MAQVHSIDGTTINYITQALWSQAADSLSLNLIEVHRKHRTHIWQSNVMSAGEWATLIGKRGSIVSIVTTSPNDPNGDYVTYYDAVVRSVTKQRHDSLNMMGVRVEFLVKV